MHALNRDILVSVSPAAPFTQQREQPLTKKIIRIWLAYGGATEEGAVVGGASDGIQSFERPSRFMTVCLIFFVKVISF
jgi:adenosylmethionine-8-amino-7-oxononanoate aminotransferase